MRTRVAQERDYCDALGELKRKPVLHVCRQTVLSLPSAVDPRVRCEGLVLSAFPRSVAIIIPIKPLLLDYIVPATFLYWIHLLGAALIEASFRFLVVHDESMMPTFLFYKVSQRNLITSYCTTRDALIHIKSQE